MLAKALVPLSLLSSAVTAETVLGVYMFHRHGDRTSKSTPPANLTDLGYYEVHTSGDYYRSRYIAADATSKIQGMNTDIVKQSQISVSAPADTVLQNSATGFLQGLYPPVGNTLATQTLRNGTNVTTPLNGYQLIPLSLVTSGTGSEDNGWLQSASGCNAAVTSSNNYFYSTEYNELLSSTQEFYDSITPVVNRTFNESQMSYKNAYLIYDLINVAEINNASIQSASLITNDSFHQLLTLANTHEWNLAYNSSDNTRAIAGMTLAAQVVQFLNTTATNPSKASKMGIQFGAYASFASFFGLANLTAANPDFYGIADYASSMAFELVTNASTAAPSADELSVRFIFHNGTASADSEPQTYPLFGRTDPLVPWTDFVSEMNKFAVGSTEQWCTVCQNSTGTCAAYASSSSSAPSSGSSTASSSEKGNGLSPAVNGVIGAMVTLAVILGLEALVLLAGGFRVVRKNAGKGAVTEVAGASQGKA
ncbi:hypothetical protein AAFC00_000031 [Neodothiora populina]|uniref:Histidine acid phosphatase n=1 Tax=Neodothiora populina TaxID=2781224 RepID=A0ABR3P152_9PEZI